MIHYLNSDYGLFSKPDLCVCVATVKLVATVTLHIIYII